ncbi:MAG: metalloregulator ArsR/SmtB family transcription factor [Gemmatimonadota bacterium]|nr:metalloregulator ArsR/SmtB family transcription factor [Gemmatimonadota bacterium]
MDNKIKNRFSLQAQVFKALAHPTRLFIINELAHGDKCVCDLTGMIGSDISTVSKHLSVLKIAGILTDEKQGTQVFYKLRMQCVLSFTACVENEIKCNAERTLGIVD